MIGDRIVVGICDVALSEKMQMDSKLTLDTAGSSTGSIAGESENPEDWDKD